MWIEDLLDVDVDAAVALDVASFAPAELGAASGDVHAIRAKSLREELARPWSRVRAARGEVHGLVGYSLLWHVVDEVQLLNIAVIPEFRRRGIGRALMHDLFAYARDRHAARILLEVRAGNAPAIALYESLGFEPFHVRKGYYADGEDGVEMVAAL